MIRSQCASVEIQVREINRCTHTDPHTVPIETTLNSPRRSRQITVSNQYETYQQIKNKLTLLTEQITQTLRVKNGSVNSRTEIASLSLMVRL